MFYAVRKGKTIGIFSTWEECKESVSGYSGAEYKKFKNEEDAISFIGREVKKEVKDMECNNTIEEVKSNEIQKDVMYAYVDGSYNSDKRIGGYGLVLCCNNKVIIKDFGTIDGMKDEFLNSRNVLGEIFGAKRAIQLAIANDYKKIIIAYDYKGIEAWATGAWKAKKDLTKDYVEFINRYSNKIDIEFKKVKAHSSTEEGGDIFNHEADRLAKMGSLII